MSISSRLFEPKIWPSRQNFVLQAVVNLTYGCHLLLEPARLEVGSILINSGFRSDAVNRKVGGVPNLLRESAQFLSCAYVRDNIKV